MKIIAIDNLGGSVYHRLNLPLTKLKADFATYLTKEMVKNYDIVWLHMNSSIPTAELALWKKQYGFKLIVDYDDTWDLPRNHMDYGRLLLSIPNAKDLCLLADHVIVSTEPLKIEKLAYNENVSVIPNRIPYREGQFQFKQEAFKSFENRKIKVGLTGSIRSHFHDWNAILPQLRRISKMNCELIFVGADRSREWHQFSGIAKLRPLQKRDEYISGYNEIDIMLCPLNYSHYNICKSEIKPLEAACSKSICVLDRLYESKSHLCDYHTYCDGNYEDIVSDLLKQNREDLFTWMFDMSTEIFNNTDYENECVKPRLEICQKLS